MSFSVGILYSAQEFLSYVRTNDIGVDEFKSAFRRFPLARPDDILGVCTRCNWIEFSADGKCRVTNRGIAICSSAPELNLRLQIEDLIELDSPVWAAKIPHGRSEALKSFPDEVMQCFKDAGLLDTWIDEIVDWWDRLSVAARTAKSSVNLLTGRKAERLSIKYEETRVGITPKWQCLDSNFSGYDVLSISDRDSDLSRMIEVKGSTLPKSQAFCFVTRNEWRTAESAEDYCFHLWCLRDGQYPLLHEVAFEEMKNHIPTDLGMGLWETVKVPFKPFGAGKEFRQ